MANSGIRLCTQSPLTNVHNKQAVAVTFFGHWFVGSISRFRGQSGAKLQTQMKNKHKHTWAAFHSMQFFTAMTDILASYRFPEAIVSLCIAVIHQQFEAVSSGTNQPFCFLDI